MKLNWDAGGGYALQERPYDSMQKPEAVSDYNGE